jgi:DNA-damage-inducible protein J
MARGTTVTARINPALKKSVEEILGKLGISHSEVINMLYSLISLRKGLPFDVKLPNDETSYILQNPDLMGQIAESLKTYHTGSGYKPSQEELDEINRV